MGLPKINIEFITAANTAVSRSANGIVALILTDDLQKGTVTSIYETEADVVKSHWSAANLDYLNKVFMGNPARVIVERIGADEDYSAALGRLKNKNWNYLSIPAISEEEAQKIAGWITAQRAAKKTFKAVLNYAANDEGVINFATEDIKVGSKTYTAAEYCCRVAGLLAGLSLNKSCTYAVLPEAESITESLEPDKDIDAGKLILINDGEKIKIARGVNSLATLSDDKTNDMKKIKIVDGMDLMRDDIRNAFESNYIGLANSYDNKIVFINAVNQYFETLESNGVLYDEYDNHAEVDVGAQREYLNQPLAVSDAEVKRMPTGSEMFVEAFVKFQDAIEDLSFRVYM